MIFKSIVLGFFFFKENFEEEIYWELCNHDSLKYMFEPYCIQKFCWDSSHQPLDI